MIYLSQHIFLILYLNSACLYSPLARVLCSASLRVSNLSWKPHIPNEAACNRQLPSPDVANGQRILVLPLLYHQFKRPAASSEVKHPFSMRSFSKNLRNESVS